MRFRTTLTLAVFSLSACQSTGGGCPPLIQYDAAFQKAAAKELRALPKDSNVAQLVVDYKKFRDACRVSP